MYSSVVLRFATVIALGLLSGCRDDEPFVAPEGTSGTGSTTDGSDETGSDGADETGGADDGCEQLPDFPQSGVFESYRENGGAAVLAQLVRSQHCPNGPTSIEPGHGVYVYRPLEPQTTDDWPEGRFPLAVFANAAGGVIVQNGNHTYPMLDALAEAGFVVLAVESPVALDDIDQRAEAIECAIEWARDVWEPEGWDSETDPNPLHCEDLALIGHSRGGGAVYLMGSDATPPDGLRALVNVAPVSSLGSFEADEVPLPPAPLLVLQGADDEDTTGSGVTNYDRWGMEDPPGSALPVVDKSMLWAYDAPHFSWGGQDEGVLIEDPPTTYTEENIERGRAIAAVYVPAFLRAHVLGETEWLDLFIEPTHYSMGPSAFPSEIQNLDWSEFYPEPSGPYDVLDDRPVIMTAYSQRHQVGAAASHRRLRVDTMYRDDELDCLQQESTEILDGSAPSELPVTRLNSFATEDVCLLEHISSSHDTFSLRMNWDGTETGFGEGVEWSVGEPGLDASTYGAIALRTAGRATEDPKSLVLGVTTVAVDDDGVESELTASVTYDRIVQQFPAGGFLTRTFLHTVHFPMGDVCGAAPDGLNAADVRSISITSPGSQPEAGLLYVDSLEFLDDHTGASSTFASCGPASVWQCEATSTLVAQRSTCDIAPVNSECPGGESSSTTLTLPHVDVGDGWDGWLVHAPPGWFSDPQNLTTAEQARIVDRCEAACAAEYASDPHASANCTASGAFETPTLVSAPVTGTRLSIPAEYRSGGGLEGSEVLACDLLEPECCDAFDEDVCPAAAVRVTAAESQLARGEEWILNVSGTFGAMSLDDNDPETAALSGTVGYSRCGHGSPYVSQDGSDPCPFYLGSVHVETTEALELEIDCDGSPLSLSLDELEIDLVQPAFGIDFENSQWKAFPPGALQLRTHAEIGPFAFDRVDVNEEAVYVKALDGWFQATAAGGLELLFDLECNNQIEPMKAWLDFSSSSAQEQPPSITIDMPTSVTCGATVDLDNTISDPDGDATLVQWELDGVLLSPSVTEIEVDEHYDIVATVRDARGASGTDDHEIDCTPP